MGVRKVNKFIIFIGFIFMSFSANATFYLKSNDGSKLTITTDTTMAVYIGVNGGFGRYYLNSKNSQGIDDTGRPFNAVRYLNDKCKGIEKCQLDVLILKVFTDNIGGAVILFLDKDSKTRESVYIDKQGILQD